MLFHKKSPHTPECMIFHMVVSALMLLALLASIVGVYKAHFLAEGMTFGTTSGSLSLIAFAVTAMFFMKSLKACFMKCEICTK